jgi:hypothetical protein
MSRPNFNFSTGPVDTSLENEIVERVTNDLESSSNPVQLCHPVGGNVFIYFDPLFITFEGRVVCSCGKIAGSLKGSVDRFSITYEPENSVT